jgi:hypothetical protein
MIMSKWAIFILKSCSLLTWNSKLTGCPLFLFSKFGNYTQYLLSFSVLAIPAPRTLVQVGTTHPSILCAKRCHVTRFSPIEFQRKWGKPRPHLPSFPQVGKLFQSSWAGWYSAEEQQPPREWVAEQQHRRNLGPRAASWSRADQSS